MDCRLEARMKEFVEELAREHQADLSAAGRLVDLEELTCQIGDELTRMLTERELARRGQELEGRTATCPDCGRVCPCSAAPDPVLLTGPRGSLGYTQPKHYCDRCRRSFFPDGGNFGNRSAERGDHQGAANDDLGRSEQQLCDSGRGAPAVSGRSSHDQTDSTGRQRGGRGPSGRARGSRRAIESHAPSETTRRKRGP